MTASPVPADHAPPRRRAGSSTAAVIAAIAGCSAVFAFVLARWAGAADAAAVAIGIVYCAFAVAVFLVARRVQQARS